MNLEIDWGENLLETKAQVTVGRLQSGEDIPEKDMTLLRTHQDVMAEGKPDPKLARKLRRKLRETYGIGSWQTVVSAYKHWLEVKTDPLLLPLNSLQ